MEMDDVEVDMRVVFGRPNGEKTVARVIKRNRKTVTVETLEERGRKKRHEPGTEFRVGPGLIRPAREDEAPEQLRQSSPPSEPSDDSKGSSSRRSPVGGEDDPEDVESAARRAHRSIRKRCRLASPPTYITDSILFLDGRRVTKHGREYDVQKSDFYRAEQELEEETDGTRGRSFDDIREIRTYVRELEDEAWFRDRFGDQDFQIKAGRGRSSAHWSRTGNIRMARNHYHELAVLHEVVHVLTPRPHSPHGRLYARMYLAVVDWRLDLGEDLRKAYRHHDIAYQPHRRPQPPYA